jgi:hypothetical protein
MLVSCRTCTGVHQISHPHHQHANEHEYDRNNVLKHPGARVSHEVESALVQQRDQVSPEVSELSVLIVLLSQVRVTVMRQLLIRLQRANTENAHAVNQSNLAL